MLHLNLFHIANLHLEISQTIIKVSNSIKIKPLHMELKFVLALLPKVCESFMSQHRVQQQLSSNAKSGPKF